MRLEASHVERNEMARRKLDGRKVAILATDGFEQSERLEPRRALQRAAHDSHGGPLRKIVLRGR